MTESAIRRLPAAGFRLDDLAPEVRHDRAIEEPSAIDSLVHHVASGAASGAWLGWLIGLCIGARHPILSEFGLVLARSSVWAAILTSIEGCVAGTLIGGLVGAIIGWKHRQKDTRRV